MIGRYGTGMRDCCDSPARSGSPHIVGCVNANRAPSPSSDIEGLVAKLTEQRTVNLSNIVQMRAILDEYSVLHHDVAAALSSLSAEREQFERLYRTKVKFIDGKTAEWETAESSLSSARNDGLEFDDNAASQWLREWAHRKFGPWITWRTAWAAVKELKSASLRKEGL